jgi:CRP-like cAMP-binding protein
MRHSQPSSARQRFASVRAVPELASCSDAEIWSLLRYMDEVRVAAGEKVVQEGTRAAEFIVVIDGRLRTGSSVLDSGSSYGWEAMWDRLANRRTVTVDDDARLLVMSHEQFRAVKALVKWAQPQHNEPGLGAVA